MDDIYRTDVRNTTVIEMAPNVRPRIPAHRWHAAEGVQYLGFWDEDGPRKTLVSDTVDYPSCSDTVMLDELLRDCVY